MEDISKKLYQALEESCDSCESKLIALSGGLDSSILAHFLKKRKPILIHRIKYFILPFKFYDYEVLMFVCSTVWV